MCLHRPLWVFRPGGVHELTLLWQVTQKKDIKRQKDKLEGMKKDAEDERTRVKEAARERVLEEFEKGQLGLAIAQTTGGTKSGGNADEREP